jgi:hypothetical protein
MLSLPETGEKTERKCRKNLSGIMKRSKAFAISLSTPTHTLSAREIKTGEKKENPRRGVTAKRQS